jgi:toxin HigB-1
MIKSFKHKGLSGFFCSGSLSRINAQHASKLARILDRLDASTSSRDMNLPGYKMHPLSGDKKGHWSVWVSGNWRVTFQFDGADVVNVDYCDYH